MSANKSITRRLILIITVCCTVIFTVTIGYFYYQSRLLLEREVEADARNLVLSAVNRVETSLASIGKVAEGVSSALETGSYSEQSLLTLLKETLQENNDIYGICAAFEPTGKLAFGRPYAPYFYRSNGTLQYVPEIDFQFLTRDWYQIAKELGRKEWSEPYYDEGGGETIMATCSVPFYAGTGGNRRFRGIVATDVSLDWLTKEVASIKVLKTGYCFLISRNGMVLTHPSREMIMNETIFSFAETHNKPELRDIGRKMVRGESGFTRYDDTHRGPSWMYYAPVSSTGWTLAVVFPEKELLAEVHSLTMIVGLIGVVGILLLAMTVAWIAHSITTPLHALAEATEVMATGNFDAQLPPVCSDDEVGTLTRAFAAMNGALKEYIRDLTETTAAKERIQSELRVATDIQTSLLPRIFPAFPDREEFDIYATMDPAKEVGGDFYDFFFIDEQNLCFIIADVADKGVPAALYMMVAKTLLKTEAQRGGEPDSILFAVNNILAADNENCMFVTVFCAILNTDSGEVRFANAGHNPPLLKDSRGIDYLKPKAGFVLGPIPESSYETERLTMQPGDLLLLYTDGVTEAKNRQAELFGEARLLAAMGRGPHDDLTALLRFLRAEVTNHADGAEQSDDVTMLAIKFRAPARSGTC